MCRKSVLRYFKRTKKNRRNNAFKLVIVFMLEGPLAKTKHMQLYKTPNMKDQLIMVLS